MKQCFDVSNFFQITGNAYYANEYIFD